MVVLEEGGGGGVLMSDVPTHVRTWEGQLLAGVPSKTKVDSFHAFSSKVERCPVQMIRSSHMIQGQGRRMMFVGSSFLGEG